MAEPEHYIGVYLEVNLTNQTFGPYDFAAPMPGYVLVGVPDFAPPTYNHVDIEVGGFTIVAGDLKDCGSHYPTKEEQPHG